MHWSTSILIYFWHPLHICVEDCYNRALVLMRSTDNEFTTENEVTDNVVDKDEDFLPSISVSIDEFKY